ncbi:toprim domain-containing protein [Stieleria neptunia]|uniref:toprim domain-containing protein n=1 Tax=Stieleria neptunia TaxID=2527979 RepID=UPI0018D25A66|nr:toprim domain-containing protein [Stieleria neptunia]
MIVGKSPDGTFFYFNAKGNDSGTIIDLVQTLDGGSLGDVRKTLRRYSPQQNDSASDWVTTSSSNQTIDRKSVQAKWESAQPITNRNPYLSDCRLIPTQTYLDPIFAGRFRIDHRGNVLAAHYDTDGLCGFEIKNGTRDRTTFTGFCPGGIKGLFASRPRPGDRLMIIAETFIDMLSVAALIGTRDARFFSTAGRPSPKQLDLIANASNRMPAGSEIQLRFDNDAGGREIAQIIEAKLADLALAIRRVVPPTPGMDWNDCVRSNDSLRFQPE